MRGSPLFATVRKSLIEARFSRLVFPAVRRCSPG
jgi:hypothetical protein